MVRGSELAFRALVREHGGMAQCYSPMLRADKVVQAHRLWLEAAKDTNKVTRIIMEQQQNQQEQGLHEDVVLFLRDILIDTKPVTVQLCGNDPTVLGQAVQALRHAVPSHVLQGIDFNLGCPQPCAQSDNFGAFLAEQDLPRALECVQAMRQAIHDDSYNHDKNNHQSQRPTLSCKIRLQDTVQQTVQLARQLQGAGCELLAVHCRRRADKHNGPADWVAGRAVAEACRATNYLPVVLNGGLYTRQDIIEAWQQSTHVHGVMVASGALSNPLLLLPKDETNPSLLDPAFLAALYLTYVERHPPPSPLFIRRHLRWIFRSVLQPDASSTKQIDYSDWRPRLWTFLVRPYLTSLSQFQQVVALYVKLNQSAMPPSLTHISEATFASIRQAGRPKRRKEKPSTTTMPQPANEKRAKLHGD